MKEITLNERKVIQLEILEMFDDFCRENNLKYSLAYGTLLGAVRHKGYIPWDDDIDVCMPRKDYEKMEKLFPQNYRSQYEFFSLNRTPHWHICFGKISDSRTMVKELKSKTRPYGVNIDVFPIDNVSEDKNEYVQFVQKQNYLLQINTLKCFKMNKHTSLTKNLGAYLLKLRYCHMRQSAILGIIQKRAQLLNTVETSNVQDLVAGPIPNSTYRKAIFDHLERFSFEGKEFYGFASFDEYLSCIYGDYMTPPPADKRISYHTSDAYWK